MSYEVNDSEPLAPTQQEPAQDADDGARPSGSLTIELPLREDDGSDEQYSDDQMSESEELRMQAGFNSPKGPEDAADGDSEAGDDEYKDGESPDVRDKMGVNSPRRSQIEAQQRGWDIPAEAKEEKKDDGGGDDAALAGFITQVSRDASPITAVPRDDEPPTQPRTEDTTDAEIRRQSQQQRSSWMSCCSWMSCARQEQPIVDEDERDGGTPATSSVQVTPVSTSSVANTGPGSAGSASPGMEPVMDYPQEYYDDGLLPRPYPQHRTQKCLVLDLDETLVHSSFKPVPNADFIIPVEIDGVIHRVYVMKRPYVDEFLIRCAKLYEVVIFTASLAKYANPLLDQLDPHGTVTHRLFRESCVIHQTAYVKDLTRLARPISKTIIVDNSAQSYLFQPKNAIPIPSWFDDMTDTLLLDLLPVCETTMFEIPDVRKLLDAHTKSYRWLCNQANKTAQFT